MSVRHLRREFQFVVVNGDSMNPTFQHGDLVVARRRVPSVSRGDAVVFTVNRSDYEDQRSSVAGRRLKRIVAVGGDRAPELLPEALRRRHGGSVPRGHIALAGDAPVSEGSAQFGYINVARIESVVIGRVRRRRPQTVSHDQARSASADYFSTLGP